MSQWGSSDNANNSPIWAPAQLRQAPTRANANTLFGNTTANGYGTGETIGTYGVSAGEMRFSANAGEVYSVTVTNPGSGFTAVASVGFSGGGGSGATATATMRVVSATVSHGGNNYAPGDLLVPSNGTASINAVINVVTTEIRAVTINQAGSGYTNNNLITINTGTGTPATVNVQTNGTGNVTSVALVANGAYTVNPTLTNVATTNTQGTGTGLTLNLVPKILSIAVVNTGSYSVLPSNLSAHPVSNLTGIGVSANIALVIGVNDVAVTNGGSGYTSAPSVSLTGTGGSGQTAIATITTNTNIGSGSSRGVAHTGWVIRTVGTGGRAGRVQHETLVAGGIVGDASDDTIFAE